MTAPGAPHPRPSYHSISSPPSALLSDSLVLRARFDPAAPQISITESMAANVGRPIVNTPVGPYLTVQFLEADTPEQEAEVYNGGENRCCETIVELTWSLYGHSYKTYRDTFVVIKEEDMKGQKVDAVIGVGGTATEYKYGEEHYPVLTTCRSEKEARKMRQQKREPEAEGGEGEGVEKREGAGEGGAETVETVVEGHLGKKSERR